MASGKLGTPEKKFAGVSDKLKGNAANAAEMRENEQLTRLVAELTTELTAAVDENERLTALVEQLRADNIALIGMIDELQNKPPWED